MLLQQSDPASYPRKLSDNKWVVEVKGRDGVEEQIIDLPSGPIDQAGWDPRNDIDIQTLTS